MPTNKVVKENLTSEEKAREYVGCSPYYRLFEFFLQEHNLILLDGQIQDVIYEVQKYLDKEKDNEVQQLKEVLREIVEAVDDEWFDMAWEGVDVTKLRKASEKAKQLLR